MRIGIPAETRAGEARVAATPETVKKLMLNGQHQVFVEAGAGVSASIPDELFQAVGAIIVATPGELFAQAEIVLKVRGPSADELALLVRDSILIGMLDARTAGIPEALSKHHITAFSLELLPRITRAQGMDVLSSQANIGGYKAVMVGANAYQRFMPMLMTAAGTVKAARVLILGAGVAGLQAIATARRLGAVIEAFDVRPDVKDQVESLGARFVEVPLSAAEKEFARGVGGYAREMSEDYKQRQAALIHERAKAADIIVTTALIPGRPAPVLIRPETVQAMKPGSVIVDMAVESGGNCPLSELDRTVIRHGVTLVGIANFPALVAADSSALYARNVVNFLAVLLDPKTGAFAVNRADEIVAGTLICMGGEVMKKA